LEIIVSPKAMVVRKGSRNQGIRISRPNFSAISILRGMVFADGHHAPSVA
jgi:hypothetical protein